MLCWAMAAAMILMGEGMMRHQLARMGLHPLQRKPHLQVPVVPHPPTSPLLQQLQYPLLLLGLRQLPLQRSPLLQRLQAVGQEEGAEVGEQQGAGAGARAGAELRSHWVLITFRTRRKAISPVDRERAVPNQPIPLPWSFCFIMFRTAVSAGQGSRTF